MKLGSVLLLNFLVAFVWQAMQPKAGPGDYILGFVVGFVMLALILPPLRTANLGRRELQRVPGMGNPEKQRSGCRHYLVTACALATGYCGHSA